MSEVCQPQCCPALMGAVMTDGVNPHFSLSLRLSAGAGSQCRHGVCRGRATGGDVLRKAQHARQHSDRPLGTRPVRNQELRRNQRGRAAVLPGGESWRHTHTSPVSPISLTHVVKFKHQSQLETKWVVNTAAIKSSFFCFSFLLLSKLHTWHVNKLLTPLSRRSLRGGTTMAPRSVFVPFQKYRTTFMNWIKLLKSWLYPSLMFIYEFDVTKVLLTFE